MSAVRKTKTLDGLLAAAYASAMDVMSTTEAQKVVRGTLFHGTRHPTVILDKGFASSIGGEFGPGIYLTNFEPTAEFYALHVAQGPEKPSVIRCRASIVRPFVIKKTDWIRLTTKATPRTIQRHIIDSGYDGIIGLGLTGQPQIVAFVPSQVTGVSARAVQ